MRTKRILIVLLFVTAAGMSGCGKTHMQKWYQASVVFTGTVNTMTAMGEMGMIDKETGREMLPFIEDANAALKELAEVAETCDKYPEVCDEARLEWLWEQVDNVLAILERYLEPTMKAERSKWLLWE